MNAVTAMREPLPAPHREFRPAALALRDGEAPASGRWTLRGILLLLCVALAWSVYGSVDVVAVASGRVIPSGRSMPVASLDGGRVWRLLVREGQAVRRGQPLLAFDGAELAAEAARLDGELQAERLQLARARALDAVLADLPDDTARIETALLAAAAVVQCGLSPAELNLQRELLQARLREIRRARDVLLRRDAALAAQDRALAAERLKLARSLPILNERAAALAGLQARGLVARQQWQEQDLARIGAEQALLALDARRDEIVQQQAEIRAEREAQAAAVRRGILDAIEAHQRQANVLARERERLRERESRLVLVAPIDGSVQQLAVRGAGSVARPAEPLLVIVPRDDALEVEAWVLNRDIGFVAAGQSAAVKIETFNFTRYGVIDGRVRSVAAEAIEHPRLGPAYAARVTLARSSLTVDRHEAALAPGMAVQVEIRTGTRRIIDYFLSPLSRVARESIRER